MKNCLNKDLWYLKIKCRFDDFLQSDWFVPVFALATLLCYILKMEYAFFALAGILVTYLFFSQIELKPTIVVFFMSFMAYSGKSTWSYIYLVFYLIIGIFLVTAIIYRFYVTILTKQRIKSGKLFFGLVAVFVALMLSGFGYGKYTYENHLRLVGFALLYIFVYIVAINFVKENFKKYLCKIVLCSVFICIIEVLVLYFGMGGFEKIISAKTIGLGWISSVDLAIMLLMFAIVMLYKASKNVKFSILYLILVTLCCLTITFLFVDTAIVFMVISIGFAWIYSYIVSGKRKKFLVGSVICGVVAIVVFATMCITVPSVAIRIKNLTMFSREKLDVYSMAVSMFKEQKWFGCGFYGEDAGMFDGPLWYIFNTPLNILFSTGIFGMLLFMFYYYQRYKIQIEYLSKFKMFALIAVLTFEVIGMFENCFLSIPINIFILLIVLSCEKESERVEQLINLTKEEKIYV